MGSFMIGVLNIVLMAVPYIGVFLIDSNQTWTGTQRGYMGGLWAGLLIPLAVILPMLCIIGVFWGVMDYMNEKNSNKALVGISVNLIIGIIIAGFYVNHKRAVHRAEKEIFGSRDMQVQSQVLFKIPENGHQPCSADFFKAHRMLSSAECYPNGNPSHLIYKNKDEMYFYQSGKLAAESIVRGGRTMVYNYD